jgi:Lrp/AsnC family transcriptional regulator
MNLDAIDKKLLALLQEDSELQVSELAERIGLSTTPCWRRVQRLKAAGVIRRQVVLVDRKAVNVPVTVFVTVRTRHHNQKWFDSFRATVEGIPEVVEFYRMSGEVDYLLPGPSSCRTPGARSCSPVQPIACPTACSSRMATLRGSAGARDSA